MDISMSSTLLLCVEWFNGRVVRKLLAIQRTANKNAIRTAMLRYTWRLLQGIYMRVRKHAYTERGRNVQKHI